jgi:hypothetical protein
MRGSNPRPLAHKTNTLPTELMEHVCRSWLPASVTVIESRVRGLVVMIVACQVMDPGSIPGERIFFFILVSLLRVAWLTPGKGRNIFIILPVGLKLGTIPPLFSPVPVRAEPSYVCSLYHTTAKKKEIRATGVEPVT